MGHRAETNYCPWAVGLRNERIGCRRCVEGKHSKIGDAVAEANNLYGVSASTGGGDIGKRQRCIGLIGNRRAILHPLITEGTSAMRHRAETYGCARTVGL